MLSMLSVREILLTDTDEINWNQICTINAFNVKKKHHKYSSLNPKG